MNIAIEIPDHFVNALVTSGLRWVNQGWADVERYQMGEAGVLLKLKERDTGKVFSLSMADYKTAIQAMIRDRHASVGPILTQQGWDGTHGEDVICYACFGDEKYL